MLTLNTLALSTMCKTSSGDNVRYDLGPAVPRTPAGPVAVRHLCSGCFQLDLCGLVPSSPADVFWVPPMLQSSARCCRLCRNSQERMGLTTWQRAAGPTEVLIGTHTLNTGAGVVKTSIWEDEGGSQEEDGI